MPRYFFHIKDEQKAIRDTEGAEFQNMDAVREEATERSRDDERRCPSRASTERAHICDHGRQGNVVLNFPFELAIRD